MRIYSNIDEANSAFRDTMVTIAQQLRDDIPDDDWLPTFQGKSVRPIVAFMAHVLNSFRGTDCREVFVPARQMVALTLPPLARVEPKFSSLDQEALRLIVDLNGELQASPCVTC